MYYNIYVNYDSYWVYQIIKPHKDDLYQTSVALQKQSKCQFVYSDLLVKAFYVCIIMKVPALLVLSVNIRYTGLVRANIRYGKNMVRTL